MKFCTHCGTPIQDGEIHVCSQNQVPQVEVRQPTAEAIPGIPAPYPSAPRPELAKVEKNRIIELLKNPLSALQLRGELDLPYGLIGLAASILGFMAWAWSFKRNLIHTMYGMMGIDQSWASAYEEASEQFAVLKPMFLLGLASLVVMIVGSILFGRWLGQNKTSWKEGITKIGASQLVSGAGFLISALALFVSLKVGLVLFAVVLIAALVLTAHAAIHLFRIPQNRVLHFITLFVLLQVVAILVAIDASANQAISDIKDSFLSEFLY